MHGWRGLLSAGAVVGIAALLGTSGAVPADAQSAAAVTADPGGSVDINIFFNALAPYGVWQQSPRWGWVWYPNTVPAGWRPYTHGHWVLTEDGWTWVSDWDWGWGPFHYGRWFDDPNFGWLWAPGAVWGPAWVMWEQGDDYIGWAPLPPEVGWSWSVGLEFGSIDIEGMLPPGAFCFVRDDDFMDRDLQQVIAPRARSVDILPRTHVVTRYEAENGRVIDRGVAPEVLERRLGHQIPRYRVEGAESPERLARGGRYEHGGGVMFYRPHVREGERFAPPEEHAPFGGVLQPFEDLLRRQEGQRRELEQRHHQEEQQLERFHNQERTHPPEGMRPEELQRRQEQERQFMRGEQERENHQIEQRQGQERQRYEDERQRGGEHGQGGGHHGHDGEHHDGGGGRSQTI